jgi:diadenosine tetraphosphatase ApaH/serine/threonine PP2A family protein phosphatase
MRIAVLSDVHGNLHALDAVLAAVERERPDAVWCLGDTVGYGPQPSQCCERVRAVAGVTLCGNHDLGVLGAVPLDDFQPDAAAAALWTREHLDERSAAWLRGLDPAVVVDGAALYHGSPRDPVWEYLLSAEAIVAALEDAPRRLVLVGHSHVALAVARSADGAVAGGAAPAGTRVDLGDDDLLLNPGSVGQPRDGDPRAAWLLLDQAAGRVEFRREDYDVEATQREIRDAGLPASLGERLAAGI